MPRATRRSVGLLDAEPAIGRPSRREDGRGELTFGRPIRWILFLHGGRVVPFVVRVESSTINRGITRVAVLDDPASRGPQVYKLYASDGTSADFDARPKRGTDPSAAGCNVRSPSSSTSRPPCTSCCTSATRARPSARCLVSHR